MATLTVVNANDDGIGSLRQAILSANAAAGSDTITFDPSLAGESILLSSGQLTVTDDLIFDGDIDNNGTADITLDNGTDGPPSKILVIDNGNETADLTVTVDGLIVTGGAGEFGGAGIESRENLTVINSTIVGNGGTGLFSDIGDLTVTGSTITSNTAVDPEAQGGGIYSGSGSLTVIGSTISSNIVLGDSARGGGIYNDGGELTVRDSTINNNETLGSSEAGGGIYNRGDRLTVIGSTLTQNSTNGLGGGIFHTSGLLTVRSSTISDNAAAGSGGGIFLAEALLPGQAVALTLTNSLIAGNTAGSDGNEVAGIGFNIAADSSNLLGDSSQTNAEAFSGYSPSPTDITATSDGTNPTALANILDPLADNGGPTQTQALALGSPAVDAGDNSLLPLDRTDQDGDGNLDEVIPFDQRGSGFERVLAAAIDIGAVELATVTMVPGPMVNGQDATIFVENNIVVGNARQAGRPYRGRLFSNTDGTDNPNDVILGTDGSDNIRGGAEGNDLIDAGDGSDRIIFGSTSVFVGAGAGDDFVRGIGASNGGIFVDLGSGNDRFYATRNNHFITGSGNNVIGIGRGNDTVQTEDGNDIVYSTRGGGDNTLDLGGGTNVVWVQRGNYTIATGADQDFIGLGNGTDTVDAGDGNNIIYALGAAPAGDKDITTGLGDDNIWTGAGSDIIDGGLGTNILTGGAGADQFTARAGALNIITDFELGRDQIALDGLSVSDLNIVQGAGDRARDTFVSAQSELILRVVNTAAEALVAADNFTTA